jgi:DNA-binding CsgD family transcriptional regulator
VVIAIERHSAEYPSNRELGVNFRLTRAEARVAALLAERMSNHEIAQQLGVTEHTARRHTEKVLFKLGVHRRTDVRRELLQCMQRVETDSRPVCEVSTSTSGPTLSASRWYSRPERDGGVENSGRGSSPIAGSIAGE